MLRLPIAIGLLLFVLIGAVVFIIFWRRARMGGTSQDIHQGDGYPINIDEQVLEMSPEIGLVHQEERLPESREISGEYGLQLIWNSNRVFLLDKLPAAIGRSEENDVILTDTSVSGTHARIYFDKRFDAVCIEDLDSLNGVYINKRPTCKNILDDGVKITLGDVMLTFRNMGYIPPQSPS